MMATYLASAGVLEETAHEDPWECLRLARRVLLEDDPKDILARNGER